MRRKRDAKTGSYFFAGPKILELLREAYDGTGRIARIVADLRRLSRADEDIVGAVDLCSIARSASGMARNEIQHRARLIENLDPVQPVMGNSGKLEQVILNLLVNAAQAIPPGNAAGNCIRIGVGSDDRHSWVEIADTGAGIAPEHIPHLFDPFFTTKPVGEGTGLGLAICRQIVSSHGGHITVDSEPGTGSRFRVVLPVGAGTAAVPVAPCDVEAPSATAAARGRLLLIDDEPQVVRMLALLLGDAHDVTTAGSAGEALERLRAGESYDLILCDLMMPEMTGMDLYREIQRRDPDLAARMIFLTGGAFTPEAREFLARISNPQIDKPCDVEILRRSIDEMLASR